MYILFSTLYSLYKYNSLIKYFSGWDIFLLKIFILLFKHKQVKKDTWTMVTNMNKKNGKNTNK